MKIQITPDIIIDKDDERNWVVKQRATGPDRRGRTVTGQNWANFAYCSSLESAARSVLEILAYKSPSTHANIRAASDELRDLWRQIWEAIGELPLPEPQKSKKRGAQKDEASH